MINTNKTLVYYMIITHRNANSSIVWSERKEHLDRYYNQLSRKNKFDSKTIYSIGMFKEYVSLETDERFQSNNRLKLYMTNDGLQSTILRVQDRLTMEIMLTDDINGIFRTYDRLRDILYELSPFIREEQTVEKISNLPVLVDIDNFDLIKWYILSDCVSPRYHGGGGNGLLH